LIAYYVKLDGLLSGQIGNFISTKKHFWLIFSDFGSVHSPWIKET